MRSSPVEVMSAIHYAYSQGVAECFTKPPWKQVLHMASHSPLQLLIRSSVLTKIVFNAPRTGRVL